MSFINFKAYEFSYLNITNIGLELVQSDTECGFACVGITSCFSYNLAAFSDVNGKLLCELLPSEKFNNLNDFTGSPSHHQFRYELSFFWESQFSFVQGSEGNRHKEHILSNCSSFDGKGASTFNFFAHFAAYLIKVKQKSQFTFVFFELTKIKKHTRHTAS